MSTRKRPRGDGGGGRGAKRRKRDGFIPGRYFAYLATNDLAKKTCKTHTYISVSEYTPWSMFVHNRGLPVDDVRSTKKARGAWRVELIVWPFATYKEAQDFCAQWREKTRGKRSRRLTGIRLAKDYYKHVYDRIAPEVMAALGDVDAGASTLPPDLFIASDDSTDVDDADVDD